MTDSNGDRNNLIPRSFNDVTIEQRIGDGYMNATAMCKACGKRWPDYARLDATKAFVQALSRSVQIPTDLLVQVISTGQNDRRGTWVHPQIAAHLAQWLSAEFAVRVSGWIVEEVIQRTSPSEVRGSDIPTLLEAAARELREREVETDKLIDIIADEQKRRKTLAIEHSKGINESRRLKEAVAKLAKDNAALAKHAYSVKGQAEDLIKAIREGKLRNEDGLLDDKPEEIQNITPIRPRKD